MLNSPTKEIPFVSDIEELNSIFNDNSQNVKGRVLIPEDLGEKVITNSSLNTPRTLYITYRLEKDSIPSLGTSVASVQMCHPNNDEQAKQVVRISYLDQYAKQFSEDLGDDFLARGLEPLIEVVNAQNTKFIYKGSEVVGGIVVENFQVFSSEDRYVAWIWIKFTESKKVRSEIRDILRYEIESQDFRPIYCAISKFNHRSINFFRAMGFKPICVSWS